jgi:hypothetical protein
MIVVPAVIPETIPVPEPTVATVMLLLLHVPPDVILLSVVAAPAQMAIVPVIAATDGFTETVTVPVPVHPAVTATVYTLTPVDVGVMPVVPQVVHANPDGPVHK